MKGHINIDKYNQIFEKVRICTDKLNFWVTNSLPKWVSFKLLPQIIDMNMKNLKALNDTLSVFGYRLKEYELFFKYSEDVTDNYENINSSQNSFNDNPLAFLGKSPTLNTDGLRIHNQQSFTSVNRPNLQRRDVSFINSSYARNGASLLRSPGNIIRNQNYNLQEFANLDDSRPISLNEILSINIRELERFGDQRFNLKGALNNKENKRIALRKLESVILERKKLDTFLYTQGRMVDQVRLYVFKRMCLMSKDQFSSNYDSNDFFDTRKFPKDEEILLETFIKFVMQNNPFYSHVRVAEILQKSISALRVKSQPKSFFIKVFFIYFNSFQYVKKYY